METEFKCEDEVYVIYLNEVCNADIFSIHIEIIESKHTISYVLLIDGLKHVYNQNHIGKTKEDLKNKLFK